MVYTLHVQLLIVRVVELLVCLHDHKFKEKHILCILSRIFDFLDSTGDASSCYYVLCHIMDLLERPAASAESRALDVLPKILCIVSAAPVLELHDGESLAGPSAKEMILKRLCDSEWPATSAVAVVKALRDVPLTPTQLKDAVFRLLRWSLALILVTTVLTPT